MSERGLMEGVSESATMNRGATHLTYDGGTSLCGVRMHLWNSPNPVARVTANHCGNCRRVYNALTAHPHDSKEPNPDQEDSP